jgi:glutamyl-tRNA synthetase
VSDTIRVRFAPSPTGHLHIGGARTAIYNWAFARRNGGTFVLRIDDTDPERSTEDNVNAIISSLRWLGIEWDEGPICGGAFGPYFQTQRTSSYEGALAALRDSDGVYPCFCDPADLAARREQARASGGVAGYDRTCRTIDPSVAKARIDAGEPQAWRLKVPERRGDIVFTDVVRGKSTFNASVMDDFVVVRTDGTPTYNFATVVDDIEMRITHVIRGDDHLSNTPRQILVFEALGAAAPTFAHLSMIWGPDGKRLSKRHGATSVETYRERGYLPEALVNYLALLGWSLDDKTTVIDSETLTSNFSLERVSKNPAIFDAEKLEWLNGVYLRALTPSRYAEVMLPYLMDAGLLTADEAAHRQTWLEELATLVAERAKRLDEVVPMVRFLFEESVTIDDSARAKVLEQEGAAGALDSAVDALGALQEYAPQTIESALRSVPGAIGVKPKLVFQAVRVAISGSTVSPPLFESLALLGKERSLQRIRAARTSVGS